MSGKWSLLYRSIICFHYSPLTTSINCCKRYKESCISEFSLLKKLGSFANHAFLFIPVITPGGSTSLILQPPNQNRVQVHSTGAIILMHALTIWTTRIIFVPLWLKLELGNERARLSESIFPVIQYMLRFLLTWCAAVFSQCLTFASRGLFQSLPQNWGPSSFHDGFLGFTYP